MSYFIKNLIYNIYTAILKMIDHDGVEHAGYMSFILLVSLFPFCVFILAFTSFFGASELGETFMQLILHNMSTHAVDAIHTRINELISSPPQRLLTLAVLGTIWTSSSFVECIRTILNRVYNITSPPNYIFRRLLSILQFLIISSIISLATLLCIIIPIGLSKLPQIMLLIEDYASILNFARYIVVYVALFLAVSSLYYVLPNIQLDFLSVMPGALLTVILWGASGYILSTYIIYYTQLNIVYGSLGSIIVTLVFFYIVNMIFIIGAEFNYLNSNTDHPK